MSDVGNRVKELRKNLGLTQEKFALQIGLKRNSLSQIENGINALSSQNVLFICKEWHVSEEWLLNGVGDMFDDEYRRHRLYSWADSVLADSPESFRYRFVDALTRLPDKWWELTEKVAIDLLKEYDSTRAEQILSAKVSEKTVIGSNDNAISDSNVSTYEVGTNYGAVGDGAFVINTDTD